MTATQPAAITDSSSLRLGVVGVNSSHLPEFTRRIKERYDAGQTRCRVEAFWTDGQHDMPADQVAQWIADAEALGAKSFDQLDSMLDAVDGVMVLAVNGHKHLAHATPALQRGLPTYHGTKGIRSFKVDFATVYDRLIDGMIGFYEKEKTPVSLADIVENVAVMAAANASLTQSGAWVKVGA